MARIRSVKPELRTSQLVASWPVEVRYFWVLFWGYLDDYGRGIDSPKTIAGDCFPWDEKISARTVNGWLALMTHKVDGEPGPVCRYAVDGKRYVHAVNWKEHQKPNRPTASRIPQCPTHERLTEPITEDDSDEFTEPLHVGAAAGSSRGAGQQRQERREPRTEPPPKAAAAAEKLIIEALADDGCSADEARSIATWLDRERKPRNLAGLVHTVAAAGELPELLARVRRQAERAAVAAALVDAKDGPPCPHGQPGGQTPHPSTGLPLCPVCRTESRGAA